MKKLKVIFCSDTKIEGRNIFPDKVVKPEYLNIRKYQDT